MNSIFVRRTEHISAMSKCFCDLALCMRPQVWNQTMSIYCRDHDYVGLREFRMSRTIVEFVRNAICNNIGEITYHMRW